MGEDTRRSSTPRATSRRTATAAPDSGAKLTKVHHRENPSRKTPAAIGSRSPLARPEPGKNPRSSRRCAPETRKKSAKLGAAVAPGTWKAFVNLNAVGAPRTRKKSAKASAAGTPGTGKESSESCAVSAHGTRKKSAKLSAAGAPRTGKKCANISAVGSRPILKARKRGTKTNRQWNSTPLCRAYRVMFRDRLIAQAHAHARPATRPGSTSLDRLGWHLPLPGSSVNRSSLGGRLSTHLDPCGSSRQTTDFATSHPNPAMSIVYRCWNFALEVSFSPTFADPRRAFQAAILTRHVVAAA